MMKKPIPTSLLLHPKTRLAWRNWLAKNYKSKQQIWLVSYKYHTGKPRIKYNDAVEEALCFGWIDSTVRSLDTQRFAQRFTPRRKTSEYSPANLERLRYLVVRGLVARDILKTLPDLSQKRLRIAADVMAAIKANEQAWKHFRRLSKSYVRIRIGFIEGARKRPQEFHKRLSYFVRMTAMNRQFGFGGIDKHY